MAISDLLVDKRGQAADVLGGDACTLERCGGEWVGVHRSIVARLLLAWPATMQEVDCRLRPVSQIDNGLID
jgi:hypothetical protein